jgi:hypothetical protein
MITLTTALLITIAVPIYVAVFAFIKDQYWDHGVIKRTLDPKQEKLNRIKEYGYDPHSPLVKRFQRLAGITGKYGDYRNRFNLANMVEDIYIPIRNK